MKNWPTTGHPVKYEDLLEPVIYTILGNRPYDGYPFPIIPGAADESYTTPEDVLKTLGNKELALLMSGMLLGIEQGKRLTVMTLSGWNEAIDMFVEALDEYEPDDEEQLGVSVEFIEATAMRLKETKNAGFKQRMLERIRRHTASNWISVEKIKEFLDEL